MYTPKRFQNRRSDDVFSFKGNSPYGSPYQSLNLSKDYRDTPSKGSIQVLEQAESHQLLTYGGNLPVKVAEVLSTSANKNVSAHIENSGWTYIVADRKLYAWKPSNTQVKKSISCFEFQLALTELTHKASLTCILESAPTDSSFSVNTKTSLINVSPEGVARYWQNISQPNIVLEVTLNIGEKQCYSILSVMPYGCILITTTNEMYLLYPSNSSIVCHQLSVSSGMLSNIGKRVSSFWSQPAITPCKYPPCMCDGTIDFESVERYIFVALERKLQKWEISSDSVGDSKMLFEVDLLKCVKNYTGIAEITADSDLDDVQIIDMKNTGYGTVLLLALWIGHEYRVVLGTLKVIMEDSQFSFERLVLVDYHEEQLNGNMKLLIPYGGYQAYVSTNNLIISQPVSKSTRHPIRIEFNKVNSGLLGAGSCGADAIYLSRRDGLINLKVTYVAEPVLLENSQIKILSDSMNEESSFTADAYDVVRGSFISFTQGRFNMQELNSFECTGEELGNAIMKLSVELLDSYPPSDPRWAVESGSKGFPATSVLLLNQLRDKQNIHDEFLKFLLSYNLLEKIGKHSDSVTFILYEGAERIRSVLALLEMPSFASNTIDDVVNSLDVNMDDVSIDQVNKKDAFFAKVSNIGTFFSVLAKFEDTSLAGMQAVKDKVELILAVSEIFSTCFTAAWQYRETAKHHYQSANHVPWTGSTADANNRDLLKQQIGLILNQGLPNVDKTKHGAVLTQQLVVLADLLLDGYLRELSMLRSANKVSETDVLEESYNQERSDIIKSLINLGYLEHARTLAEQYKDFHMLIVLCEKSNDEEKLEHYKVLFKNEGFANVLYKWYMDKGAWSQVMSTKDPANNFGSFLSDNDQLSWIHFIGSKEFSKASNVLTHLAAEEKEYSARKKTMLALANLAALASGESKNIIEDKVTGIDREMELLKYQEVILESLNKDTSEYPPLSAESLIKMCLDDNDAPYLTESQYISLMEILQYLSNERDQLTLDIWSKCILQDNWDESPNLDSIAVVSQKMFFKCLKYWTGKGIAKEVLPSLKHLATAPKLASNFPSHMLHQLKVCYEVLNLQNLAVGI